MLKRLLFALLVCILGFAGSASAAKPRPKLSVKSVSSPPATAKAGDTFVFTVKVANKGDIKGKGRLKVSLRKTKNGPVAAALFSKRVKVPAKSKKSPAGRRRFRHWRRGVTGPSPASSARARGSAGPRSE